jgi:hypothetical protein
MRAPTAAADPAPQCASQAAKGAYPLVRQRHRHDFLLQYT